MLTKKESSIFSLNFFSLLILSLVYVVLVTITLENRRGVNLKTGNVISNNTLGAMAEEPPVADINYPKYIGDEIVDISARSVFALDVNSGAVLYEKNSSEPVFPASTAKIITALVAFDSYSLDTKLTVPKISVDGQKVGLYEGEVLTVEDLLYSLLLSSANDAAEVLAQSFPGGRDLFIAAMNIKVKNLGLENSIFFNPSGLDQEGQQTTAQDMVKASFYAMQNPVFERMVGTKKYTIYGQDGMVTRTFYNINRLLGEVEGVKGIKTGKTDGAMENLLTYVDRNGTKIIIAILGSTDRFGETTKLIDWIYENYTF